MATITRGSAPLWGVTKFRVAVLLEIDTMFPIYAFKWTASRRYSESLSTLRGKSFRSGGDKPATLPKLPHVISTVRAEIEDPRSEEHTSELQSRVDLVCR